MIEKNGFKFPAALSGLIESPPLLDGENPEHFLSFLQAVVEDQKPLTILDWVSAIDIAIKAREELRLKRSSVALIHGGMLNALISFLSVMKPTALGRDLKYAGKPVTDLALKYFSNQPDERAEVIARLAQHGVTLAEVQAKAVELNRVPLQMLERMIAAREKDAASCARKRPSSR